MRVSTEEGRLAVTVPFLLPLTPDAAPTFSCSTATFLATPLVLAAGTAGACCVPAWSPLKSCCRTLSWSCSGRAEVDAKVWAGNAREGP